ASRRWPVRRLHTRNPTRHSPNWTLRPRRGRAMLEINLLHRFIPPQHIDSGLSSPGVGATAGPDSPPSIDETGQQDRSPTHHRASPEPPADHDHPRTGPTPLPRHTQIHALKLSTDLGRGH